MALSDELRESLRAAGLEPREGAPGLFLLRDEDGDPVVPADGIKLEGETKVKAEAMRDELASLLREKGVEAVPKKDLKGVWLAGANQRCNAPGPGPNWGFKILNTLLWDFRLNLD